MKLRLGFISNSSSASFLIATKEELTKDALEKRLSKLVGNSKFAEKATKLLWDGISYDGSYECEPYELEFYEITIDQGEFHYYPGSFGDEGLAYRGWFDPYRGYDQYKGMKIRPEEMYGLLINERDFKLCVGFLKKGQIQRRHINVKDKIYVLQGVTLNLRNKQIKSIQDIEDVEKIKNLMFLDLSHNKIKSLEGFEQLPKLKKLNLSENNIKIFDLENPTLEDLDLSNNQIKDFSRIDKLPSLETLHLDNNNIEKITNLKFNNIKELYLSNNSIRIFDKIKSDSLEYLHLSNNQLKKIGRINLPNLRWLSLENNPIETLEGLKSLHEQISNKTYVKLSNSTIN